MNGIPTECYKLWGMGSGLSNTGYLFFDFIREYWKNPDLDPDEFHQVRLTILPKSGDLSDPNKWRGICLLDIASKVMSSIIADRLRNHLLTFGIDEECGHIGCADANFSIKSAIQILREYDTEAYVLFVDLVKAYDTINRDLVWKILTQYGVPDEMLVVIKKLYQDVTINLKVGEKMKKFGSNCGVKEGDNLAPILFLIFMNAVATSLQKEWIFQIPQFRRRTDTTKGIPKGKLTGTNWKNKGK